MMAPTCHFRQNPHVPTEQNQAGSPFLGKRLQCCSFPAGPAAFLTALHELNKAAWVRRDGVVNVTNDPIWLGVVATKKGHQIWSLEGYGQHVPKSVGYQGQSQTTGCEMRQRNEESVSRYMPLSINGRVIACQLKCARVDMKVAHCDSTITANFSTANIRTHLTGGRNWCQWVLKKGLRLSHFGLPVQYSANFQSTVNLLVASAETWGCQCRRRPGVD